MRSDSSTNARLAQLRQELNASQEPFVEAVISGKLVPTMRAYRDCSSPQEKIAVLEAILNVLNVSPASIEEAQDLAVTSQHLLEETSSEPLPGSQLSRLASFLFNKRVYQSTFKPAIDDEQSEFIEAMADGRQRKAKWIRYRVWIIFFHALLAFAWETTVGKAIRGLIGVK
ncbi:MAG: hypothetical protein AAGI53_17810 [Planctomycetota bacterium]